MTRIIIFSLAIFSFAWACNKDYILEKDYPRIVTMPITNAENGSLTLNARVINFGNDPISDMGFIVKSYGAEVKERKYSVEKGRKKISEQIEFNTDYYSYLEAYAFIETADFQALGDVEAIKIDGEDIFQIIDFYPKSAGYNDTITIRGNNFKNLERILIRLGNVQNEITYISDTLIEFRVKAVPNDPQVRLKVFGDPVNENGEWKQFAEVFSYLKPEITEDIKPVRYHDTFDIAAKNINLDGLEFRINLKEAEIIYATEDLIRTTISSEVSSQTPSIQIKSNGQFLKYKGLYIEDPVVSEFSELSGKSGDTIIITGEGFVADKDRVRLRFGLTEFLAPIISAERDRIVAIVPERIASTESSVKLTMNFFSEVLGNFVLSAPEIISTTPSVIKNKSSTLRLFIENFVSNSEEYTFTVKADNSTMEHEIQEGQVEYHEDGITLLLNRTSVFDGAEEPSEGNIVITMKNSLYEKEITVPFEFE